MKGENAGKWWIRSTAEVCEFFGISNKTLNNWEKRGAPKLSYGKWDLQALVEWKHGGTNKDESAEVRRLKAEADLKEAKAAQEKIKLAVTEGKFIPTEKVTSDLRRLFSVLKKSLLAIGHNVATEINSIDPESAVIANRVIDDNIHEALEQLSRSGIYGKK